MFNRQLISKAGFSPPKLSNKFKQVISLTLAVTLLIPTLPASTVYADMGYSADHAGSSSNTGAGVWSSDSPN